MKPDLDIAIIGGGAAGLAAGIFTGEAARGLGLRIEVIEGAAKPGAKILVSGGGRCNVTNVDVSPSDFSGGPQPLIRSVLKAFPGDATIQWINALGVPLKLEPTGKYFPVSNKARTVLDALLHGLSSAGAVLRAGTRVTRVVPQGSGFSIELAGQPPLTATRVVIATGGLALPKSGSDGAGLQWLRQMGHRTVPTTPALVPLLLAPGPSISGRFAEFSGLSFDAVLAMRSPGGKVLASARGSCLFTHFGLSGPAPMDLSRHIARHRLEHGGQNPLVTLGHPKFPNADAADEFLRSASAQQPRESVARLLSTLYPARFAEALADGLGSLAAMTRAQRRDLTINIAAMPIPVIGDRGYTFAETNAGGVDLREVDIRTMESRRVPGLHLCGELLDADGRIGGFNFQWAWATGFLAGRSAVAMLKSAPAKGHQSS